MYVRLYILLLVVRVYFALQPSYIHPDEHFQGPEIITGLVFGWPSHKTWEFTSEYPIRSVFPLYLAYGFPLTILKWIYEGLGYEGQVPTWLVFYTLRAVMFGLNFVLEDWALHELIHQPRERKVAVLLVASSYVTWCFQAHTFSNSLETLLVLWALVLIGRLRESAQRTKVDCCIGLAFIGVLGVFNRITFPAWILVPGIQLLAGTHLFVKPLRLPIMFISALFFLVIAVDLDTQFYLNTRPRLRSLFFDRDPSTVVFTPWNNLRYNLDTTNLAEHGLHPFWQHFVANLPQLIGPAIPLLFLSPKAGSPLLWSGLVGIGALSCFAHQEPRFLLPAIPLLLASMRRPQSLRWRRVWIGIWITFNISLGILFGIYHQGGVVPTQLWLSEHLKGLSGPENVTVMWWKTYSPPNWLLGESNQSIITTDLMGMPKQKMVSIVSEAAPCQGAKNTLMLVAPANANFKEVDGAGKTTRADDPDFRELWRWHNHIGLDDLDFGDDGVLPTLERVIGQRGLVVWDVSRRCK